MNGQRKRSFGRELLFWVILLGLDAGALLLIHRGYGRPWNYMDTMPVMLSVGAFVPLLAAVLRYFPKKKGLRIAGAVVALGLGVLIGQAALRGFYGEHPFIKEALLGKYPDYFQTGEIGGITARLYKNGEPDSDETDLISFLEWNRSTGQSTVIAYPKEYRRAGKSTPEPEAWLQIRFTYQDGRTRDVRLFDTEDTTYAEETGEGLWKRKNEKGIDNYQYWLKLILDREYSSLFLEPLDEGRAPMLSPEYTGGEKAVSIDRSREIAGRLQDRASWSDISESLPQSLTPERARDVRWVFVKERIGHRHTGVWVEAGTGKKVSDQYDNTFRITVYDLVTGEEKTLAEGGEKQTRLAGVIKEYFGITE